MRNEQSMTSVGDDWCAHTAKSRRERGSSKASPKHPCPASMPHFPHTISLLIRQIQTLSMSANNIRDFQNTSQLNSTNDSGPWGYPPRRKYIHILLGWVYVLIFIHRRVSQPMACAIGKHFGRFAHQSISFGTVIDEAKVFIALQTADVPDIPQFRHVILTSCLPTGLYADTLS